MLEMASEHSELLIGLALFVASELIGLNPRLRSNSLLQLIIGAAMRAFPYEPKRRNPGPGSLLDSFRKKR